MNRKSIQYMLLASVFFALMNVSVKYVSHLPAVQIIFFRSIITFILSLSYLKAAKINPLGNNKKLLLLRGGAGAVSLTLYFITLQEIPLATAVTIQYLSPIFTTILGIFIVKEKVKPIQWLFFAMAFGGVLIIEGFDPRMSLFYLFLGITSALFSGIAYNVIRKLNTTENPMVIVFYFPLVTTPFALIYCLFNWVQPVGWDWLVLLFVGVMTQFAQFFMTKAYQSANLSKISTINYIGIIYALGFGFFLFGESFNFMTYIGMALVLTGVVLNVIKK
ncbi:DMT family transporter [Penaeicola halotolerans]|uniref:DMT family transporter n=1 Tax=Penaeicola halotolerans TaxID=2793196 RepID=UPI001CF7EFA0|nr:DMT family transporter [Penaeicola halotolerans]